MLQLIIHRRAARAATRPRSRGPMLALAAVNLTLFLLAGCAAALVGSGIGAAHAYNVITSDLPNPKDLTAQPLPQVTQIYDRTGEHLLYEFYDERRLEVPLASIAPMMVEATLAIEDANFYQHQGFDPRGIARAAYLNWRTGGTVSGASTITQQLVKRMLLSDEQ